MDIPIRKTQFNTLQNVISCIVKFKYFIIYNSVNALFISDNELILYANILIKEIPVLEEAIGIIDELKSCRKRFVVVHDVTVLSEDFLSCVDCPVKPQKQKAHKKSTKSKKKSWDLAIDNLCSCSSTKIWNGFQRNSDFYSSAIRLCNLKPRIITCRNNVKYLGIRSPNK